MLSEVGYVKKKMNNMFKKKSVKNGLKSSMKWKTGYTKMDLILTSKSTEKREKSSKPNLQFIKREKHSIKKRRRLSNHPKRF